MHEGLRWFLSLESAWAIAERRLRALAGSLEHDHLLRPTARVACRRLRATFAAPLAPRGAWRRAAIRTDGVRDADVKNPRDARFSGKLRRAPLPHPPRSLYK